MKKNGSNYSHLFTETPKEAKLFDRWLDEWESAREIRATVAAEQPGLVDAVYLERARGDYAGDIEAGQIRILSKRFTEEPWSPPFVAVLEEWHEGMWLVAPFSPYSTPASPGEMSSRLHLLGRETIQVWNARTVQTRLLAKSFLCGSLDAGTLEEARALFRNQLAGTPLPKGFKAIRGSEIRLEADPRREHLAESMRRLRPLATAVRALERALAYAEARNEALAAWVAAAARRKSEFGEALLAAGTKRPTVESYTLGNGNLDVEISPESGMATLTFYGEDGTPTTDFDGYGMMGADMEFWGTFGGGTLRVPAAALEGGFLLVDPEGVPVDVQKKQE